MEPAATTQFWLDRDGKRLGPFDEAGILEGVETGVVRASDLLHVEGMRDGIPVWEVLAQLGAVPAPVQGARPAVPRGRSYLPRGTRPSGRATAGLETVRYAGFWARLAALVVDALVLVAGALVIGIITGAIGFFLGMRLPEARSVLGERLAAVATLAAVWLYFAFLESSPAGATIGKQVFYLQVLADRGHQRISFLRASCRWVARWLSWAIFLLGYLIQPFTPRKRALHDLLSGTVVIARAPAPPMRLALVLVAGLGFVLAAWIGFALLAPGLSR